MFNGVVFFVCECGFLSNIVYSIGVNESVIIYEMIIDDDMVIENWW